VILAGGLGSAPGKLLWISVKLRAALYRSIITVPNATLMGPGSEVFANLMGPANRQGHGATRKVHAVDSPTSWGHPIARVMGPPPF
jgi:hypothetical protein